MPELPEVEVVRRGLERWAVGRSIETVEVLDSRSLRSFSGNVSDFVNQVQGASIASAQRRGKFLWLPLSYDGEPPQTAVHAHLGMSGQMLISALGQPDEKHLKVRFGLVDDQGQRNELRFVDQRIFGGVSAVELLPDEQSCGSMISAAAQHIAPDPLDPSFSLADFTAKLQQRKSGIKRALLDQKLISGIGNIYADEALWAARVHYDQPSNSLSSEHVAELITEIQKVLEAALAAGGTSFDSLYVNVNGASGYFSRSLNVYGREGKACYRCDSPISRQAFMNRSAYFCPQCQLPPVSESARGS